MQKRSRTAKAKAASTQSETAEALYNEQQRSVGQQTISNDRTYMSPQVLASKNHEFQDYSPTFYKPHMLKSLVVLLAIIFTLSQTDFLE